VFYAKIDNHVSRQGNMVQTLAKYVALLIVVHTVLHHDTSEWQLTWPAMQVLFVYHN
jgi:hypothetical protein